MDKYERYLRLQQWLDMLWQLRWSAAGCNHIPAGDCQSFFDYLNQREFNLEIADGEAPTLRSHNTRLTIRNCTAEDLLALMPARQRTNRRPHRQDGYPIFVKYGDKTVLIDGRRRINTFINDGVKGTHPTYILIPNNEIYKNRHRVS